MSYGSPPNPMDQFRDFVRRGGIPVTNALLVANVLTALVSFFVPAVREILNGWVSFNTAVAFHRPWTFLTYPFTFFILNPDQDFFNLLFGGFFFWSAGGSLERGWGSKLYAQFFFVITIISAASLMLGAAVLHIPDVQLYSFFLPMAGTLIAFCTRNPEETAMFFFLPMKAKYLALIVVAYTWFKFGPALGLFACGGMLAAFLYMRFGRSFATSGYSSRSRDPKILHLHPNQKTMRKVSLDGSAPRGLFDFAGRWRDYQEKKRLEQLLKNSGFTDKNDWLDDDHPKRR